MFGNKQITCKVEKAKASFLEGQSNKNEQPWGKSIRSKMQNLSFQPYQSNASLKSVKCSGKNLSW